MNALTTFLAGMRQRFDALPPNDRRALLLMFAVIGLTVVYFSLAASRAYQQRAVADYKVMREDFRWFAVNLPQVRQRLQVVAAKPAGPAGTADASLINRATTSAKPFGIVFKRFQPEGETGLRLWIEAAEFDQLMRWLAALEKQQIQLDQLDVDKLDKQVGMVDARVLVSLKP